MADRPPRTLLEQRIRQRCMTYEEFVQHAETFARDHCEPGTLSLRHLQRLVSGRSLGALRPATARLLERIFGEPIAALLASPKATTANDGDHPASELRRLDRKLGAIVVRFAEMLEASVRESKEAGTLSVRHPQRLG